MRKPASCTRASFLLLLLATVLFVCGSIVGTLVAGRLSGSSSAPLRAQAAPAFVAGPSVSSQPSAQRAEAAEDKVQDLQHELRQARLALVAEQRAVAQAQVQLQTLQSTNRLDEKRPAADSPRKEAWMVVAIPTVHRAGQDYLNPTLASILSQLPRTAGHPLRGALRIVVADNSHGATRHAAFEKAKAELSNPSHPHYGTVAFVRNPCPLSEGAHSPPHGRRQDGNKAGPKVRQQTRDVTWLLHAVSVLASGGTVADIPASPPGAVQAGASAGPSQALGPVQGVDFPDGPLHAKHVLLMEDDFRLCPHAVLALAHLTAKAAGMPGVAPMPTAQARVQWGAHGVQQPAPVDMGPASSASPWLLLRVCYGLNGAVLHTRDVPALAAYLAQRGDARPPDHLLVEWFAAERPAAAEYVGSRAHFTFRYNLLDHFGRQSSLRAAPQGTFGACYDPLDEGNLFAVEAWNMQECGHDDMQPCRAADDPARLPPLHLKEAAKGVPLRVGAQHSALKAHLPGAAVI